jgi:hypothetical protein
VGRKTVHETDATSPLVAVKGPSVVKSETFGKHRLPLPAWDIPSSSPPSVAPLEDPPEEELEDMPPEELEPLDELELPPLPLPLLPELEPPELDPLRFVANGCVEVSAPEQWIVNVSPIRLSNVEVRFMKIYPSGG